MNTTNISTTRTAPRARPSPIKPDVGLTASRIARHTPLVLADDDHERRRRILEDPEIHKYIRTVASRRGVPPAEVEDVLQDVLAAAWTNPGLPLDDRDDARLYLGGTARHKAIDRARARKRYKDEHVSAHPAMPDVASLSLEDHTLAHQLLGIGRRLFPRTSQWFERSAVEGESLATLAAEAKVSHGHVRHEVSVFTRHLRTLGTALATLIMLVIGLRTVWRHDDDRVGAPPPREDAPMLRAQAERECAAEEWRPCARDLKRAAAMDPAGETLELRELREEAERKVHELDAPPQR